MAAQASYKKAMKPGPMGQAGKTQEPGDGKYRKCADHTSAGNEMLLSGGIVNQSDRPNDNTSDKDPGGA